MLWISPHDFGGLQASKGGFTHRSRLIIEEDEDVYGFYYQRTDGCFDSKQSSIRNVSALHDFGKVALLRRNRAPCSCTNSYGVVFWPF